MALTPPTLEEYTHYLLLDDLEEPTGFEFAAQQATDLMYMATGLTDDPTDTTDLRILINGICGMMEYVFNPPGGRVPSAFSQEQIGNYMYRMARNVSVGIKTGIDWFDAAVQHFTADDFFSGTTIKVFEYDDNMLWEDGNGQRYIFGPAQKAKLTSDWSEWDTIQSS